MAYSGLVTERRIGLLLVLLLIGQLVLLTSQVPEPSARRSVLEGIALRGLAPVAQIVATTFDFGGEVRRWLRSSSSLREENSRLSDENARLEEELARLRGVESELMRLSEAMDYTPPSDAAYMVTDITFIDHKSWLRTMVVRMPLHPPFEVRPDAPVASVDGVVGRVIAVSGRFARVQLLTDRASSVGAMVERTRRQGIVRGGAEENLLSLNYLPLQADVAVGDRVVTAGIDGVYPRGMLVGQVVEVGPGDDHFHRVKVAPAVDFGHIDQVYIIGLDAVPEELTEPPS